MYIYIYKYIYIYTCKLQILYLFRNAIDRLLILRVKITSVRKGF